MLWIPQKCLTWLLFTCGNFPVPFHAHMQPQVLYFLQQLTKHLIGNNKAVLLYTQLYTTIWVWSSPALYVLLVLLVSEEEWDIEEKHGVHTLTFHSSFIYVHEWKEGDAGGGLLWFVQHYVLSDSSVSCCHFTVWNVYMAENRLRQFNKAKVKMFFHSRFEQDPCCAAAHVQTQCQITLGLTSSAAPPLWLCFPQSRGFMGSEQLNKLEGTCCVAI